LLHFPTRPQLDDVCAIDMFPLRDRALDESHALRREVRATRAAVPPPDVVERCERALRLTRATFAPFERDGVSETSSLDVMPPTSSSSFEDVGTSDEDDIARSRSKLRSSDADAETRLARDDVEHAIESHAHGLGASVDARMRRAIARAMTSQTIEPYESFFAARRSRIDADADGTTPSEVIVDAYDAMRLAKMDLEVLLAIAPKAHGARIAAAEFGFIEATRERVERATRKDAKAAKAAKALFDDDG